MIHVFTANVHYKECQIQPTTSQGCCQTFKDYLVFYQTSLVQLAYEGTGVTLNSAFSQIRLACVSLLPVLRGELFGNWNPEIFLQCDMILLSWSTGLWDIQHLENRLLCFSIKVHEDNRLVSLLREAPLEVMREGYLPNYGYYYTGAYTTLLFVKKKKKSSGDQFFIAIYWSLLSRCGMRDMDYAFHYFQPADWTSTGITLCDCAPFYPNFDHYWSNTWNFDNKLCRDFCAWMLFLFGCGGAPKRTLYWHRASSMEHLKCSRGCADMLPGVCW